MKDIKYLYAYILPLSAVAALVWQGAWSWASLVLAFVILPALEQLLPQSVENFPESAEEERSNRSFFDWMLYLNAPLLFGIVIGYFHVLTSVELTWWEIIGLTSSVGVIVGAIGINVAHELGHRANSREQTLSKLMLLPALYQHFFIEHNRGHHKNIATDKDPASARFGEHVYAFWWRSVTGSWTAAWQLERERLTRAGLPVWSWHNEMLRFQVFQALWLVSVGVFFGPAGLIGAIAIAVFGFLLLETVNYIEHYGLRRQILPSGRPEPVSPRHSWNSNHELGRIMLYELTRHSDHHFKATRKYQILRHMDESPQMPYGYPTSMLMALVPPLWFRVMNKLVPVDGER